MESHKDIHPPKLAVRFLNWYCKKEIAEDLEGDLNEYFVRNVKSKGARRARLIYFIDVLKFLRPYTIRKPKFVNLLIQWVMIGSYIKTSGRSLLRNQLFSSINIVGLAISMSVGLVMISMLSDLFSYDKFHVNRERIYRVASQYQYLDNLDNSRYASTSLSAGNAIKETFTGIEKVAILEGRFEGDVKFSEKIVSLSGKWANETLFDVFTFPLVSGNPQTALKDPYSVVLTETAAKKLFGDADPMGKGIILADDTLEHIVRGVMKDVPMFSHMRFDVLISLSTRQLTAKNPGSKLKWDNIWNHYVYLLLPEHADLKALQTNLNALCEKENPTVKNTIIRLSLQPMTEIALGEEMNNAIGPVMPKGNVWMIGVLSFIVILSACFNYTNLSIARSLRRSREVGIRKVVGALKSQVLVQFVIEAVMIALFALAFSFLMFMLLRPYFLSLDDTYNEMLVLELSPRLVISFILLAIGVGVMAGFFPALFFARINAIKVLKNISSSTFKNITVRKALIVAQFTVSLMFIAATIIGYKHYKQILAFDLGFKTENILNIRLQNNKPDLLKKEILEIPEVKQVAESALIAAVGSYWGTRMKYVDPQDSASIHYNFIDENFIPVLGHELLAGRNFIPRTEKAEESELIVNEQVLKRFNIGGQDPQKAIGEIVTMEKKKMVIIGVVKDFKYGRSTDPKVSEVVFRYSPENIRYLNVKINTTDWPATLSKIEDAWRKIDTTHPLEARFYDDEIERAYSDLSARIKVIGTLALLAICIAAIGLLGMVVFTTETRLKEISIRKVLGATEGNLIYMMSKGFLALLAIASLIALPVTHYYFVDVALADYAEQAPASLYELALGVMAVMMIALLLIVSQTLKVAKTSPANVLKAE